MAPTAAAPAAVAPAPATAALRAAAPPAPDVTSYVADGSVSGLATSAASTTGLVPALLRYPVAARSGFDQPSPTALPISHGAAYVGGGLSLDIEPAVLTFPAGAQAGVGQLDVVDPAAGLLRATSEPGSAHSSPFRGAGSPNQPDQLRFADVHRYGVVGGTTEPEPTDPTAFSPYNYGAFLQRDFFRPAALLPPMSAATTDARKGSKTKGKDKDKGKDKAGPSAGDASGEAKAENRKKSRKTEKKDE